MVSCCLCHDRLQYLGVTFVSVPGMVGASNFSYLQMMLGFMAGQFIIAFLLTHYSIR